MVERPLDLPGLGETAPAGEGEQVDAVAPLLVGGPPAQAEPRLRMAEVDVLGLGVVEDDDAALQVRIGVRLQEDRGAVVAGERVRIAHEDRVAGRIRAAQIEVAAEVGAHLDADVLQAVEGGRHQAVALQVAVVLPLELAEFADLDVEAGAGRQHRVLGLAAEADPRLVDVELARRRGRVALVEVQEVDLGVRLERLAPDAVQVERDVRQLDVRAGVDRLLEDPGLARRQLRRGEGEADGEAVVRAVAEVRLRLQSPLETRLGGRRCRRRGRRGLLRLLRRQSGWQRPCRHRQTEREQTDDTPLADPTLRHVRSPRQTCGNRPLA